MLRILTITSVCWAGFAAAQEAPARLGLSTSRLNEIALRWAVPEELAEALARELEQTYIGLDEKRVDTAIPHWREFLRRRELQVTDFDPGVYVDYLLHRVAVARNVAVLRASERLLFFDAQETAVLEHLSTVDKQISIYAGEDKPQVPLREPQLADYAEGVDPVTLAPAKIAGVNDLIASLQHWRERAPALSQAREIARESFVKAVAADAALGEELQALDVQLRAEIKTVVVREVKP